MSKNTRFLSRLLGLYCLIVAATMILNQDSISRTVTELMLNRPLMFTVGIITLFAGLAMVLVHNVWSGGVLPIVVTLVGWLTLVKAVLILLLPPALADLYQGHHGQLFYVSATVSALLGIFLTYGGFRAKRL